MKITDRFENPDQEFGSKLRAKFPIFAHSLQVAGRPLSFLDSAASSQKPSEVIDRLDDYLRYEHANIHRGAYELSARATDAYEAVRKDVASFIGADSERNIIYTKGATESINVAALSLGQYFKCGDVVMITMLEHHSNIVPWQMLAKRMKLELIFTEISDDGSLDLEDFRSKVLSHEPKVISFTMLSNALGTLTPVMQMMNIAKSAGALVLLDAAQYAAHEELDVAALGCDFLVFSAHKLYGPTGAGILYASDRALDLMEPVYGGGDMISSVTSEGSQWAEAPQKFEAGTPAIAEIIAMGVALNFLQALKKNGLVEFEKKVFNHFWEALKQENNVELYGPKTSAGGQGEQESIISFNIRGVHPHDFATVADRFNVQIRAGHHCAQPLLKRLGLQSTARVSLGAYSDVDQIEPLIEAVRFAAKTFG